MTTEDYNKHWVLLSPKVYVEIKAREMLLYHTESGASIETVSAKCHKLVRELQKDINLGVIEFTEDYRRNDETSNFVTDALQKDIFILLPVEEGKTKPITLLPILNLQRDIDKFSRDGNEYLIGRDILHYLNLLNIYINEDCDTDCSGCDSYYRQFPSCTKRANGDCLYPEDVHRILSQAQFSNTVTVNILGGNLSQYDQWERLWYVLNDFEFEYHFWMNLKNVSDNSAWMRKILLHNVEILITPDLMPEQYHDLISRLANNPNVRFHHIVESINDGSKAERLAEKIGEDKVSISPFYNSYNWDFFNDNIFLTREDIFVEPVSMRTIFCNQKLNSNFFGALTIMSNGDVLANPNKSILGNIHINRIVQLIYNEILTKSSWRSTRDGKICSKCLYQYLCPPPSNYELSLGRENLCNII